MPNAVNNRPSARHATIAPKNHNTEFSTTVTTGTGENRLTMFHGEATAALARLFARLDGQGAATAPTGTLRGPVCALAHTLVAHYPWQTPPPDFDAWAMAVVPDPCFWSPGQPYLYEAQFELSGTSGQQVFIRPAWGLRTLGVVGRRLRWDGKPWVPRVVRYDRTTAAEWAEWRALGAVACVRSPDDALCDDASRQGVALWAELPENAPDPLALVRRWSCWAAVAAVVLPSTAPNSRQLLHDPWPGARWKHAAPNLLWVAPVAASAEARGNTTPGADIVWCEADHPEQLVAWATRQNDRRPLVAALAPRAHATLTSARAACDSLQSALANRGVTWAGYAV